MAKTHPHIESPTPEQLAELLQDRPAAIRDAYLALHEIVRDNAPDAAYSVDTVDHAIGYGARQFGYTGWGMASVTPFTKWASLTLLEGANLPDPQGLLTGTSTMRHVKVSMKEEVATNKDAIAALVRAATTRFD